MRANRSSLAEKLYPALSLPAEFGADPLGRPLHVVCVGAHPDDAETGCGGTLARLAAEGHRVSILYLTRGESGIRGEHWEDAARVRSAESISACEILQSDAYFANQFDGQTSADPDACLHFADLLLGLGPDLVFTHWPLDTHADHRATAQLVYQAWQWSKESFVLAYYEVMTGVQTHHFQPNCFVDISETWAQKRSAIYAHKSQRPDRFYPYHVNMEAQRGAEAKCSRAEAFFVVRERAPKPLLPFEI